MNSDRLVEHAAGHPDQRHHDGVDEQGVPRHPEQGARVDLAARAAARVQVLDVEDAVLGDEHAVHDDVVAAGARQSGREPHVVDPVVGAASNPPQRLGWIRRMMPASRRIFALSAASLRSSTHSDSSALRRSPAARTLSIASCWKSMCESSFRRLGCRVSG
ncbi:hypothetical protein AB4Z09_13845 [Rhodococcus sp. TAF43]